MTVGLPEVGGRVIVRLTEVGGHMTVGLTELRGVSRGVDRRRPACRRDERRPAVRRRRRRRRSRVTEVIVGDHRGRRCRGVEPVRHQVIEGDVGGSRALLVGGGSRHRSTRHHCCCFCSLRVLLALLFVKYLNKSVRAHVFLHNKFTAGIVDMDVTVHTVISVARLEESPEHSRSRLHHLNSHRLSQSLRSLLTSPTIIRTSLLASPDHFSPRQITSRHHRPPNNTDGDHKSLPPAFFTSLRLPASTQRPRPPPAPPHTAREVIAH